MKITFFIGSMQRGGAERVISILAERYRSLGWSVSIVMLLHDIVEYDLHEQIHIEKLIGKHKSYVKNAAYWFRSIRNYLKTEKPDRVVSFIGRINALVLTASLGLKLPIVISERNDPKHDGRGKMMQWYCNRIYHTAKAIVYQTQYEKSCFDKALDKIGCVIPNPVNVSATHSGTEFSNVIATAGRLVPQKNQAMLVSAMALVHEEYPEAKCEIYGDGALKEELAEQIHKLSLGDTVTLKGSVTDIHERLAQCGLFVMTSNFEGLSNALIEAMMVGLPCITTDYPGARELIEDGKTGIVVPMDDAEQLARAIKALLNDPEKCRQLAQAAQSSAAQYRAAEVIERWEKVIGGTENVH